MKIGNDTGPPGPEIRLPVEIVGHIVSYVARFSSSSRTLWSCCLLSHDWYDVTIPYLYKRPLLVNKNFDLFTNTMCPKVNSHVRNIGLKHLVKRLDMGRLAYESSNSLTARLIGRVRFSLEEFVAPPVSFSYERSYPAINLPLTILSVSCLAPLSKSDQLQVLDLSRVYNSLDVAQILYSIRNLAKLTHLALPDTAKFPVKGWMAKTHWPPALVDLRSPGWLFDGATVVDMVVAWPPTLTQLTIKHCMSCPLLADRVGYEYVVAPGIKSLALRESRHVTGGLGLRRVFAVFPSLVSLSIPVGMIHTGWPTGFPDMTGLQTCLERLELVKDSGDDADRFRLRKHDLLQCIATFPQLWQITLDESCFTGPFGILAEEQFDNCDDLTLPLKQRASEINRLAEHEKINMDEAGFFFLAE